MCDPTVLAIGSTVAGLAGTAASGASASAAASQQKQAYDEWAANQSKLRAEQNAKQEQDRQIAEKAQTQGLQDVSAGNQKTEQQTEQDRLTAYLQGQDQTATPQPSAGVLTPASDKTILSGQQGGDQTFQKDLATKLNAASADAKQRIAALATVSSYGPSSGGLDVKNALAFQKSGTGIDMANDFRRGDLSAYGVQRAVDPLQYQYTPSPLAGMSNQALQFGTQGLGNILGKAMKFT